MIPPAEVDVDVNLVQQLLQQQHPDLADLPIRYFANGWDNELFHLGDELLVRLPRRPVAAEFSRNERQYLPAIARRLPLPVSVALRQGKPGCGFPWDWCICPWLEGNTADRSPPDAKTVKQWAAFLKALHTPAPADGPINPHRGGPLASYRERFNERLDSVRDKSSIDFDAANRIWRQGLDADSTCSPCWLHGDLHPLNILCMDGRFTGVIDWMDMCVGDVAVDLASFYMLFPQSVAEHSLQHDYGLGQGQLLRARASALFFAIVLLDTGIDADGKQHSPSQVNIARKTFTHLSLSEGPS